MNAVRRMAALVLVLGLLGAAVSGQDKGGELSEKERTQLEKQAGDLLRQGVEQYQKGRIDEAIRSTEQCLTLRRKLYPQAKYPDGHPDLATSLNNLGGLLQARGEYAEAEPFCRDALAMSQRLAVLPHILQQRAHACQAHGQEGMAVGVLRHRVELSLIHI